MRGFTTFVPAAVIVILAVGCNQNANDVSDGPTLADAPTAAPAAGSKPFAEAPGGGPMRDGEKSFAKAFLMHNFVEALYSVPKNKTPNPQWTSPLADPANGRVWCTDCHDPAKGVDVSRVPRERTAKVDELEGDHEFMVELMTKWVGRLNNGEFGAKVKLKQPVTCTTCHATDPRDG